VSLADVGVSTNLDGTLSLDENKLNSVIATKPGLLGSVVSSNVVNGSTVKGSLQRILDMTNIILAPTSSFNTLAQKAQKVDLPKIELEVTKLDDAMTALQAKYLKQFSAMQTAVQASKNTQDSLTQSMASWSASLKG
jgi:flagellar hook-associated protein 2